MLRFCLSDDFSMWNSVYDPIKPWRPETLGSQVQTPRIPCSNQLIVSTCTYII